VPFAGGQLEPAVLDAALRLARADEAVFVPAYLIIVPFSLSMDSPLTHEVEVALPLLEAVELRAQKEGVPVDARLERGRSLRDALRRLWDVERFDRILLPVSADERAGFDERDIAWILMHAPTETLALRPASGSVRERVTR
jgi:nucleotide-binding universal stress UspA family protein